MRRSKSLLPHISFLAVLAVGLLLLTQPSEAQEPPRINESPSGQAPEAAGRVEQEARPGEVLVRLKQRANPAAVDAVARSAAASVASTAQRSNIVKLQLPEARVDEALARLRADPQVAEAGRNLVVLPLAAPNDEHFSLQWHLQDGNGVNATLAWDMASRRGEGVVVAVIDSGAAYEDYTDAAGRVFKRSPDFEGTAFVAPFDFVDDDAHANDEHGHGTHVAGTIAARTGNGYGAAGIASAARIMPVRVIDWSGTGTLADLVEAIHYAVDNGADLINLSIGLPGTGAPDAQGNYCSEVVGLGAALDYAYSRGVAVVAAAGNSGGAPICPAAYPTVIAVGASTFDGAVASYSSRGATLDVVAPGGDPFADLNGDGFSDGVLQTTYCEAPDQLRAARRFEGFCDVWRSGTSMAAAHASGILALILAEKPDLTPDGLRAALQGSALDAGAPGWDADYGWGRVSAPGALGAIGIVAPTQTAATTPAQTASATPTQAPSATPTPSASATPPPAPPPFGGVAYPANVQQFEVASARVIDGDTLEVWNGNLWGIGYIGVDAPPGNTDCGRQATWAQWALTGEGVRFLQELPFELDERGRRLYHAFTPSGALLGEELIRAGLARAVNVLHAYLDRYLAAEAEAKAAGRGCLWSGSGAGLQPSAAPLSAGASGGVQPMALPGGFAQDTVVSGLTEPTAMAFLPDGRILVALKSGVVRVIKNGSLLPTPLIDIRNRVNDYWDHGLIGIAVDPQFQQNPDGSCATGAACYVYLFYTYENNANDYEGLKSGRLARYTLTGDTASPASEVVILGSVVGPGCPVETQDCIPSEYASHSVGNVKFAADGTLFVSTGDAASFNQVDDRALRAQSLNSLAGKILRITRTGQGVSSNPFWNGDPAANRSKVYAYGLRNPYRFNLRPGTSTIYIGDVGWSAREEVSAAPPGANLGWPCYEGSSEQPGYASKPTCVDLYNRGPSAVRAPVIDWTHDAFNTCCSAAVTGGMFYNASVYPAQYQGKYFFGDYGKQFIKYIAVNSSDFMETGSLTDFQTTPGAVVDIELGPDGNIYYIDIESGALRRVRYIGGGNHPPTIVAQATPLEGPAPLDVTFSSAGTFDPDADALNYAWDFGDGSPVSNQANTTHRYLNEGIFTATLTVADGRGGQDVETFQIVVGSTRPVATISQPSPAFTYKVGDTITYAGSATDGDDGVLPASSLSWQVLIHHCPNGGECHTHFQQTGITGSGGSFQVPDHGNDFYFEIVLTATDSDGLSGSASVEVRPRTVPLTLATNPSGLQVVFDGVSRPAPAVIDSVVGSSHTIEAPSPQGAASFLSWSDGGARQHVITVGESAATYTATFQQSEVITFDDRSGQDQALNGQYPSGVVNWGSGQWYHSGPWGLFTTKSVSFTGDSQSSGSFTFLTPRRLVAVDVFNGGGSSATVTLRCAGQADKVVSVGAGQMLRGVATGWTGTCGTVTFLTTNGWNTNFDNLVHDDGGPAVNQAPQVSAGLDQSVTLPGVAQLDGTVSDDGLPNPPGVLSVSWSVVSGPGAVSFGDARAVDTTASFGAAGVYVLRLSASDGELSASDEVSVTVLAANAAPTVAEGARAEPNPVAGTSAQLSVLGADDGGEGALTYTWSLVTGPAGVSFSVNGTNAAKRTVVSFTRAGSYLLRAVIRDAGNLSVSSDVTVVVQQTATGVVVTPSSATVIVGGTQQFTASVVDQFGQAMAQQPVVSWGVSGGGTVSATGLFTAGAVAGGPYALTATAGSISGSAQITVTAAPSGLVAAYGFEETSGNTITDASGAGNKGTLSGATRTASGRFGRALSFDGINDRVNIADSSSLDLTSGMTLEAWVRPTSLGGWDTVVLKEQPGSLVYALYANTGPGPASGEVDTSAGYFARYAPSTLPLNTWTHLAVTFDGSRLRLYVNGVLVTDEPAAGTIKTSSGALRIGGNAVWGEYFAGLIDEVRVYNRALSQAEVQVDMNRPVK